MAGFRRKSQTLFQLHRHSMSLNLIGILKCMNIEFERTTNILL